MLSFNFSFFHMSSIQKIFAIISSDKVLGKLFLFLPLLSLNYIFFWLVFMAPLVYYFIPNALDSRRSSIIARTQLLLRLFPLFLVQICKLFIFLVLKINFFLAYSGQWFKLELGFHHLVLQVFSIK